MRRTIDDIIWHEDFYQSWHSPLSHVSKCTINGLCEVCGRLIETYTSVKQRINGWRWIAHKCGIHPNRFTCMSHLFGNVKSILCIKKAISSKMQQICYTLNAPKPTFDDNDICSIIRALRFTFWNVDSLYSFQALDYLLFLLD